MKHENEPEDASDGMCMCNFCDELYDPYDRHTCKGNDIPPRLSRKAVEDESTGTFYNPDSGNIEQGCPDCAGRVVACNKHFNPYASLLPAVSALATQQGGDHYRKLPIQPVEYIIANGIGFLAGNVIKYASRYKDKGGAEDIRKIKHYCDLILEFEYKETK